MQPQGSLAPDLYRHLETAIQPERLARYLPAAKGDPEAAFAMYSWNLSLCETFVIPLHYGEIVSRIALHRSLVAQTGKKWFDEPTFRALLDPRHRQALDHAVASENTKHGGAATAHHVVSALSLGFWRHLTTPRFDRYLWAAGVAAHFPHAPAGTTRQELNGLMTGMTALRNRIAHHQAIFDKKPMRRFQEIIRLLQWSCPVTAKYVAAISKVPLALQARPR